MTALIPKCLITMELSFSNIFNRLYVTENLQLSAELSCALWRSGARVVFLYPPGTRKYQESSQGQGSPKSHNGAGTVTGTDLRDSGQLFSPIEFQIWQSRALPLPALFGPVHPHALPSFSPQRLNQYSGLTPQQWSIPLLPALGCLTAVEPVPALPTYSLGAVNMLYTTACL